MTYEEIHKIAKVELKIFKDTKGFENQVEFQEKIVVALEKQIPKKPKNFLRSMHTQEYLCPLCKTRIISKINGEFIAGRKDKYCSHCGQAIDWSE